jgi:protein-tyrosine phosphatase
MPSVIHATTPRLLFVCTGNYYRSRFAEELWRHHEGAVPSGWLADSGGLSFAGSGGNVGPMSPHALDGLLARRVQLAHPLRMPRLVNEVDFAGASHVVAMSRSEHRPMIASLFPAWVDRVEYWDVEDTDVCAPEIALDRIEACVEELHSRLRQSSGS